jgi:hypothetical protein
MTTTTIITIPAALAAAVDTVGAVHRVNSGPYGWGYNVYDDKVRAYRVSGPATYLQAVASRASTLAVRATVLLTEADATEVSYYAEYETGTARERCKALVRRFGNLED